MEGKISRAGEVVPHRHVAKKVTGVLEDGFGGRKEAISFLYFRPDRLSDLPVLVLEGLLLLLDLLEE